MKNVHERVTPAQGHTTTSESLVSTGHGVKGPEGDTGVFLPARTSSPVPTVHTSSLLYL